MPRIVVISGLANSGKMPLGRKLMAEDPALVMVHRDTIRDSLIARIEEWQITEIMGDVASRLLKQGHSVIVVAWNLEMSDAALWRGIAKLHGVPLTWLDTRAPDVQAMIPPMENAA